MSRRQVQGLFVLLSLQGCGDPVRDAAIEQLGGEVSGVPKGPLHRPGQPCLLCHHDDFPSAPAKPFSIAGTIYRQQSAEAALGGAEVVILDSDGRVHREKTNCSGNFYVTPTAYKPTYPVWITVRYGAHSIDMESPIYREGSCAACHTEPLGPASAGKVFLSEDFLPDLPPSVKCR